MDKDRSADPADQRILIHELTGEIEALRRKRQEQWREGGHPEAKRFSQEELTDLACPSYKNLLLGRTNRLPTRATVLAIADYLECSIHETNDLLLAAQYLPEVVELPDDQYQAALERAKLLAHTLPLPAMVFGRRLQVEDANVFALRLNNLATLSQVPLSKRTGLHWFFDPSLPSYQVHAADNTLWRRNARINLAGLCSVYQPFGRERWFTALIEQLSTFPDGNAIWQDVISSPLSYHEQFEEVTTTTSPFLPTLIRETGFIIQQGVPNGPFIAAAIPHCPAAHYTYRQVGCALDENRWEQIVAVEAATG